MLPMMDDIKSVMTTRNFQHILLQFGIIIVGIIFGELIHRFAIFGEEIYHKKSFTKAVKLVFADKHTQYVKSLLVVILCMLSSFLLCYTGQVNFHSLDVLDVDLRIWTVVLLVWCCFRMFGVFNNSIEDMEILEESNADLGPGLAANYWVSFLMWALKSDIRQKMEENLKSVRRPVKVETDGTWKKPQFGENYRSFDKFIILLPDDCHLKIKDERILKQEYIDDCIPELCDGSPCSHNIEFKLEAVQKRAPMKQTVHWIYESSEYEKEANKIFVIFDFPQLLQSAMGPDRGWDEEDRPGARTKNIQAFKKTLRNLMNPNEFIQYEKDVLFLSFPNRKKPLSAVLREKILEVEKETREKRVYSSSSGAESEP